MNKAIGRPDIIEGNIPENLVSVRAGLLEKSKKFYISISFKALSEFVRKNKVYCLIKRENDKFILVRSNKPEARKLTSHGKTRIQISIPKTMLSKDDLNRLSKRNWIKIWVKFNPHSFGVDISDFFTTKEEKELVKELVKNNLEVLPKNIRAPFDIRLKNKDIVIEVHNSKPSNYDIVMRHSVRAGQVLLRIFEGSYNIQKLNLKHVFIILNKMWESSKHVTNLINDVNCKNVYVIFTNFKGSWTHKIVQEIQNLI